MDLVIRRGFALPRIHTGHPFPSLSDLRRAFVDRRDHLAPFERGYSCASDACMFRPRAPVHEIASQMSRWVRGRAYSAKSWRIVDQAIEKHPRSDDYRCGGLERSRGSRVPHIRNRLPRGHARRDYHGDRMGTARLPSCREPTGSTQGRGVEDHELPS
jgi:hypothetical protein